MIRTFFALLSFSVLLQSPSSLASFSCVDFVLGRSELNRQAITLGRAQIQGVPSRLTAPRDPSEVIELLSQHPGNYVEILMAWMNSISRRPLMDFDQQLDLLKKRRILLKKKGSQAPSLHRSSSKKALVIQISDAPPKTLDELFHWGMNLKILLAQARFESAFDEQKPRLPFLRWGKRFRKTQAFEFAQADLQVYSAALDLLEIDPPLVSRILEEKVFSDESLVDRSTKLSPLEYIKAIPGRHPDYVHQPRFTWASFQRGASLLEEYGQSHELEGIYSHLTDEIPSRHVQVYLESRKRGMWRYPIIAALFSGVMWFSDPRRGIEEWDEGTIPSIAGATAASKAESLYELVQSIPAEDPRHGVAQALYREYTEEENSIRRAMLRAEILSLLGE